MMGRFVIGEAWVDVPYDLKVQITSAVSNFMRDVHCEWKVEHVTQGEICFLIMMTNDREERKSPLS
jgi:hypothetical protein